MVLAIHEWYARLKPYIPPNRNHQYRYVGPIMAIRVSRPVLVQYRVGCVSSAAPSIPLITLINLHANPAWVPDSCMLTNLDIEPQL